MKFARFVLKIIALCLAVAAAVCAIIAYWDKIAACFGNIRACLGVGGCCHRPTEFDDYADWDE